MIYDKIPDTPLMNRLQWAAREFCVDKVETLTGPFFHPPLPDALEDFGVILAAHFKLRTPQLAIVHRDLELFPHTDASAVPFEATNLAVFFRRNVSGGRLAVWCGTAEPQEFAAADAHVLVFDGRDLTHTVRPFLIGSNGYRITLTYYTPKESPMEHLEALDRLAGGVGNGPLVCTDCNASYDSESFAVVDPGDMRHVPCWQRNVNGGKVKRVEA